jgi:hypothetical protein
LDGKGKSSFEFITTMIHTKMSILYYKAWYEIKMTNSVVVVDLVVFFLPFFLLAAMSDDDDDVSTSFALDQIAQTLPRGSRSVFSVKQTQCV